jgi:hypothetical protein
VTGWLLVAVVIAALWAVPIVGTLALFGTGSAIGRRKPRRRRIRRK